MYECNHRYFFMSYTKCVSNICSTKMKMLDVVIKNISQREKHRHEHPKPRAPCLIS